jgi:hypothetical protein
VGSSHPSWIVPDHIDQGSARWGRLSKSHARGIVSLHCLQFAKLCVSDLLPLDTETRKRYGEVMDITTRISSKPAPDADHHIECSKDHVPIMVRFTSCSPNKGFGSSSAVDCLFYEMEDAAAESIIEAIETSEGYCSVDDDAVRDIACEIAQRADGLLTGGKAHVRNTVEVAA